MKETQVFVEKEIKWCEEHKLNHSDYVTSNPPSPEFQEGFLAGLKQVQWFIDNYAEK